MRYADVGVGGPGTGTFEDRLYNFDGLLWVALSGGADEASASPALAGWLCRWFCFALTSECFMPTWASDTHFVLDIFQFSYAWLAS